MTKDEFERYIQCYLASPSHASADGFAATATPTSVAAKILSNLATDVSLMKCHPAYLIDQALEQMRESYCFFQNVAAVQEFRTLLTDEYANEQKS